MRWHCLQLQLYLFLDQRWKKETNNIQVNFLILAISFLVDIGEETVNVWFQKL